MTIQQALWIATALAVVAAGGAMVMDLRRTRRPNLDAAGWMPWRGLQVLAFFTAFVLAIFAAHGG